MAEPVHPDSMLGVTVRLFSAAVGEWRNKSRGQDLDDLHQAFVNQVKNFEYWGRAVGLMGSSSTRALPHEALHDSETLELAREMLVLAQDTFARMMTGMQVWSRPDALKERIRSSLRTASRSYNSSAFSADIQLVAQITGLLNNLIPVENDPTFAAALSSDPTLDQLRPGATNNKVSREVGNALSKLETKVNKVLSRRLVQRWILGANMQPHVDGMTLHAWSEGTCEWISGRQEYQSWLEPVEGNPKFFWIHGPPGSGKTVLCSRLVANVKGVLLTPVAHFFLSFETELRRDPGFALQSWAAQVVGQHEEAFKAVDLVQIQQAASARPQPKAQAIQDLLATIARTIPECTFILDGLDECTVSIGDFLGTLARIFRGTKSRVLLLSRYHDDMRKTFETAAYRKDVALTEYAISRVDIQDDLQTYARALVDVKVPDEGAEYRNEVAKAVTGLSDNSFVLLKMQAETARGLQATDLAKTAKDDEKPTELEGIYRRHWERIMTRPERERKRAMRLLTLVAFSLRPLRVDELVEGVLIDLQKRQGLPFPEEELPVRIDQDYIDREITWLCRPLLTIVKVEEEKDGVAGKETAIVQFSHSSAKSFFLDRLGATATASQRGDLDADIHSRLALLCLHFIQSPLVWRRQAGMGEGEESKTALFDYTTRFWRVHFERGLAAYNEKTLSLAEALFDRSNPVWDDWTRYTDIQMGMSAELQERERNSEGGSPGPLHYAAGFGLTPIVERLIRRGEDVTHVSGMERSAMKAACSTGNLPITIALLDAGADAGTGDSSTSLCPIHLAAMAGHSTVVTEILRRYPSQVHSVDIWGRTPLVLACDNRWFGVAQLLLDHGADPNMANMHGLGPLHIAARRGDESTTQILIKNGASVDMSGHHGIRPIHMACFCGASGILGRLLNAGAGVEGAMDHGWRGIHFACHLESADVVQMLLHVGVDADARDDSGLTPLHMAIKSGHTDVIMALLDTGSDVRLPDSKGMTALHVAARCGRWPVVRNLLERGAEVSATDEEGWTALHIATQRGHVDIMSQLLEAGSDPCHADRKGWTPLHVAARYGSEKTARLLLKYVTDASGVTADGWSALSLSVSSHNPGVPIALVDHVIRTGGDINAVNPNPRSPFYLSTALHVAAADGILDSVKLLIDNGADLECRDKDEHTALSRASRAGYAAVAEFLIYHRADTSVLGPRTLLSPTGEEDYRGHAEFHVEPDNSLPSHTSQPGILSEQTGKDDARHVSSTEPTISALSQTCLAEFVSLGQAVPTSHYSSLDSTVDDQAGRFQIWASNIGALQKPESTGSLDFRLRNSELMRTGVQSSLERLQSATKRGKRPNRTEAPVSSVNTLVHQTVAQVLDLVRPDEKLTESQNTKLALTELSQLFLNIQSCITHLFELSVLIRRERPRGRTQPKGVDKWEVDPSPDITSIKDKFPKIRQHDWLAQRMGTWITQQREYIRYRQKHRQRLAKSRIAADQDGRSVLFSGQVTTMATSFHEHTTPPPTHQAEEDELGQESIRSSSTSFATTAPAGTGAGRRIPELTDMWLDGVHLGYNMHIECPYCRTIQIFADRYQWKRHVYSDLQLYMCTYKNCTANPFSSSHEWFQHEMEAHRRQWKCILCNAKCASSTSLDSHFIDKHAGTVLAAQRAVMVKAGEQAVTRFDDIPCLLCDKWQPFQGGDTKSNSRKFQSHMEKHMQELAREALPLAIDGLDIRDSHSDDEDDGTDIDSDDIDNDDEAVAQDADEEEEASDLDGQTVQNYDFLQIAVSDPVPFRSTEPNRPEVVEWACLAPVADGTTNCDVKVMGTRPLLKHYKEAHAHCRRPSVMFQCLSCRRTMLRDYCLACEGEATYFGPRLYAEVQVEEALVASYVAMINRVMYSRLVDASVYKKSPAPVIKADPSDSNDEPADDISRKKAKTPTQGVDSGRDRFAADPMGDDEDVDTLQPAIWEMMRAGEDAGEHQ